MIKEIINWLMHFIGYHIMKRPFDVRGSVNFVKENLKEDLIIAEIGVFKGKNTEIILNNLNVKKIYLIDPYSEYNDSYYDGRECFHNRFYLEEAEQEAKKRLSKFKDVEIVFIKKTSDKAIQDIPDKLDFIYIDGNHSFKQVKKDINNYYKKVREGGVLGGHDIHMKGVHKAFVDFLFKEKPINYYIKDSDWFILKQKKEKKFAKGGIEE